MTVRFLLFVAACLAVHPATAQPVPPSVEGAAETAALLTVPNILRNSVSNLHAEGDTLWVGPFLNVTTDGGATWQVIENDSLFGSRNRVFSVDVEGDVIWAGVGYTGRDDEASAGGFLFSTDGGETFRYRLPQLDRPDDPQAPFIEIPYGQSTIRALPVIVNEQSPPFDIDYDPRTGDVWVAGFASGIRVSENNGATWQLAILPPDSIMSISPTDPHDFFVEPRRGNNGFFNYLGFSVLVDEEGVVWAGTSAGVNRSRPEDIDPASGDRAWTRFSYTGGPGGLVGNWTPAIEEQPLPGRNPVWFANWAANLVEGEQQRYGVTVTRDGGATFEQVLVDVEVIDFAFRGETVYAAARTNGLFISDDGGQSWRSVTDFYDPTQPDRFVRRGVDVVAVATTPDALWVGTDDGLLKSTDGGATWRLFRTEVPLSPDEPSELVPEVDTYAYPNPFSPASYDVVRIRYELAEDAPVTVRIFDFGMNLVRELADETQSAGVRELAWDGTGDDGLRVANGPYFYLVEAGDATFRGKILVLE